MVEHPRLFSRSRDIPRDTDAASAIASAIARFGGAFPCQFVLEVMRENLEAFDAFRAANFLCIAF